MKMKKESKRHKLNKEMHYSKKKKKSLLILLENSFTANVPSQNII